MQKLLMPLRTLKTKLGYTVFMSVLVVVISTMVFLDAAKAEVVVAAEGDVQTVKTNSETVGELLEDLGIDIGQYDQLSHAIETEIVDGMEIRFQKAHEIILTIDEASTTYHTTAITVGQFFDEEDITFSKFDEISHSNIAILDDQTEITIEKAFPVIINDGGKETEVQTTEDTVEDLLEAQDIKYDKTDRIEPGLDQELEEDMEVSVTYIEKEKEKVEEKIPFEEVKKKDSSLEKGKTRVISEGKEGKRVKTYEITLENGEEAKREIIDEKVAEKSKDKVVAVGTKQPPKKQTVKKQTQTKQAQASGSGKTMTMVATAYGPDCSGCSGISATGINLKNGGKYVAVDPSVIPLGSKVWVEGYGEAIAADTGGAIKGNRIDVLMASESQARNQWGRRTVQVKVLD